MSIRIFQRVFVPPSSNLTKSRNVYCSKQVCILPPQFNKQFERCSSEKIRDFKDFRRYDGRPDDPWHKGSKVKSPHVNIGRVDSSNGKQENSSSSKSANKDNVVQNDTTEESNVIRRSKQQSAVSGKNILNTNTKYPNITVKQLDKFESNNQNLNFSNSNDPIIRNLPVKSESTPSYSSLGTTATSQKSCQDGYSKNVEDSKQNLETLCTQDSMGQVSLIKDIQANCGRITDISIGPCSQNDASGNTELKNKRSIISRTEENSIGKVKDIDVNVTKSVGLVEEKPIEELKAEKLIKKRNSDIKANSRPKLEKMLTENRRFRVYSFGLTETGALGLYKPNEGRRWRKYITRPLRNAFAEENRVISAETGYGFTLFYVKNEDNIKLYGSGLNSEFQLGPIKAELLTYPSPIEIPFSSNKTKIISLSAGRAHSVVATDNEGVFLFGSNSYGQCGRRNREETESTKTCTVTQIQSLQGEKAVNVICGQDHTFFITENGNVYSCGWSIEGQTGLGHTNHVYEPTAVKGDICGEDIVKIAGRCDSVLALNAHGELFGWGCNEFKQLKDDDDTAHIDSPLRMKHINNKCGKIIDISAGSSFCMVLNEERDVFVWGRGILGAGPECNKTTIPIILPKTLFGTNDYHTKVQPSKVYCGVDHMVVVNNLKHVYAWGKNKHGCLGIGNARDQYFPYKLAISADAAHVSCAVDHTVIVTNHD